MNIHLYQKIKRTYIYQLSTDDLGKAMKHASLIGSGKYQITTPTKTYHFSIKETTNE